MKILQKVVKIWIFPPICLKMTCCWEKSSNVSKKFRLTLLASQSVQNSNSNFHNSLSDLHKNPGKFLNKRHLYKWNAIQIQLHKNTFLHCGLGWPEWTYTRIWGVDKKATFSHKSSKFDTRIWKEEFISSIRNMCAVESILIMFKNVEKTRLCLKVWAIKAT